MFLKEQRLVQVKIGRTKTCKTGAGVVVEISDTTHPLSAYKLLRRLFRARGLATRPSEYVFCMVRAGALTPYTPSSKDAFRKLVKASVAAVGQDPSRFSSHSARAGGATDLFAVNVPYPVIILQV